MTLIETIKTRKSCRTYGTRAVEPEKLAELRQFLASNRETPFGGRVRFQLLDLNEMSSGELGKLTTYGVIKGARQFMVGTVEKRQGAMEDCGYSMENNILRATSLGLGTCWLGGTFKRSGFAGKISLGEGELLPVISPVGYAGERRSVVDRAFRFVASSDKRRPWNELFYHRDLDSPLDKENAGRFDLPLECVRMAPSASNKQPWRIIKEKGRDLFHFYLKRTPGYGRIAKDIELQNIDIGIAMCHFDLSTKELGLTGAWNVDDPRINAAGLEYIVSWTSLAGSEERF